VSSSNGSYPEPEGWDKDGFWADSGIDADYETGLTGAVRPTTGPHDDPGYSYWSDNKGWENSPGGNAGASPSPGGAPWPDATRAGSPGGGPDDRGDRTRMDYRGGPGPGADPTAFYGDPRQGPGGPGGPGGPYGPGGPGGPGPGRPGGPAGPGGSNGKRKGSWWRHWTWKKALAVTGGVFGVFLLSMAGVYEYLASGATIPVALASANYQATTVYYSDGTTVLGTISAVNRRDLTLNQIPQNLQNAVLAAEERGYWTDGAISPTGILRSAYDDVVNHDTAGGSTITQEFVRGYYAGIGTQQTVSRKIKEIFVAQKLAKTESKQWVLEHYLNLIYLGDNSYGVAAAAQTYFGLPVSKLSVAQDAVIAAIIQGPSDYPLPAYRTNLIARWHYVLNGMVTMNVLTPAQAAAETFPKMLTDSGKVPPVAAGCSTTSSDRWAPYLMNLVCREMSGPDKISQQTLETGGLKIVTTISLPMEKELYNAVDTVLSPTSMRNGGSSYASLPLWALVGAELQDPQTGAMVAMYPGRTQKQSAKNCTLNVCMENTAVDTREAVGSSFKPYVLSTAVQQGMDVQNSILDTSPYVCVAQDASADYSLPLTGSAYAADSPTNTCAMPGGFPVDNDGGEIIGKQVGQGATADNAGAPYYADNVQNALAASSNTGFTDLAHKVGTQNIVNMAAAYGVNVGPYANDGSSLQHMVHAVADVALGVASLTVNEQTTMVATVANGGAYHTPHIIKYWQLPAGPETKPVVDTHQVLTQAQDSQVQYAMEDTTLPGGTAYGNVSYSSQYGHPVISKTGTTTNNHSAFFVGATPQYAMVVGMFTSSQDSNSTNNLLNLGGGGFGGYWPARIWDAFALKEFVNPPANQTSFLTPMFSGQKWNLLGPVPKSKKKAKKKTTQCTVTHGRHFQPANCVSSSPTPTPTNSNPGQPTSSPTTPATPTTSATPTSSPTVSSPATATATSTTTAGPGGGVGGGAAKTVNGVQAGLAVGGVLAVLPGSLLWTTVATRKRRRRRRATGAGG
jgi:membrane peptidoglycan carboxypeptidase